MRIGVLGASGFLGSWICRVLSGSHDVTAILRPTSSDYRLKNITGLVLENISDHEFGNLLTESNFDALILCDWEGVSNIDRNKPEQFRNVDRQSSITKLAIEASVKLIVGVGSQAELGPTNGPIFDSHKDGATTAYGEAKIATRLALQEISDLNQTRFIWMRVFSTYGPLDTGNWLIPQSIDSIVAGKEVLLTKCEQEWNYLHAYDLARAFKFAIEDPLSSGIYNVGDTKTVKLETVMKFIGQALEAERSLIFGAIEYRPDQVMELNPQCEKLQRLGWEPLIKLEDGISQTINWLRGYDEKIIFDKNSNELYFSLPNRG